MTGVRFEWDEAKNIVNPRKHGLSFDEARQAFIDPFCLSLKERVVDGEERWPTFGIAGDLLLLMVVHTVREEHQNGILEVVRIISARRATAKERRRYEAEDRSI